jgi:hypothetical protein
MGAGRVEAGDGDRNSVAERRAMHTEMDANLASVRTLFRRAMALAQVWRKLLASPYRPEKHYMRGPGPKWREKYNAPRSR